MTKYTLRKIEDIKGIQALIEQKPLTQLFDINDKVSAIRVLEQLKADIIFKELEN